MIIQRADGGRQEFAMFDSSTPIPRPSQWGMSTTYSGERVDFGRAVSLPAFMRGVRLISETAAGLPLGLYRGHGDKRKPNTNAAQLSYLRRPNPDQTPFSVWSYVFASLIRGNAYLWKVKVGGKVKFLYPVNPAFVTPKYEGDRATFELRDREYGPVVDEVGKDRIIHIPGILLEDQYVGVSVVASHRHALGTELSRQRFEGRFLQNDTNVGDILSHPGNPTETQRTEIRSGFESRHMGHPGRPAVMWGGWSLERGEINLHDAQFIESKAYSVRDIARMLGVPAGMLEDPEAPAGDSPELENLRFLQHGLSPWMSRVEQGLVCDTDLFPEPDWEIQFDEQGFLRAALETRYNAYRLGRQGGWITANEIRAREGLPPVDGGDKIQETPVGGAQNSSSDSNSNQGGGAGDANAD